MEISTQADAERQEKEVVSVQENVGLDRGRRDLFKNHVPSGE